MLWTDGSIIIYGLIIIVTLLSQTQGQTFVQTDDLERESSNKYQEFLYSRHALSKQTYNDCQVNDTKCYDDGNIS